MSRDWLIEEGTYGPRFVATGSWSDAMLEAMLSGDVRELELNYAKGWVGSDIEFLRDLPFLEAVEVANWRINDIRPVNDLHKLRYLGISTYCKTELNFSNWPDLEECSLDAWRPKASSLFGHRGIKCLFINKWNHGKDLTGFSGMTQLESLRLYSPTRLETLCGIESLAGLKRLEIALATRLASLSGIEKLLHLKHLEVNTCRKIRDIAPIAALRLKEFFLLNCGDIDTIKLLAGQKDLEKFLFYQSTNVLDGDLSVLTTLPNLKDVAFQERRHYSHTRSELLSL